MKKIALLLMALASTVALGGTASGLPGMPGRSVATDGFVTKTTAALTLYVDPLGSDNNTCTGTLTNACASLTGAFSKVPQFVNHTVTIGVAGAADGGIATYLDNITLNNVSFTANVSVTGPALVNTTPATGTATGTLTAVTVGTATTVLEDNTQTWAVNDLLGTFVTIGGVTRVVATNTATTLTLASNFAATPVIGNSYALQVPGAVFSTSSTSTPVLNVRTFGNFGGIATPVSTLLFTGIDFKTTGASGTTCQVALSNGTFNLTNSRCLVTTAGTALIYRGGGQISLSAAALVSGGTSTAFNVTTIAAAGGNNTTGTLNLSNSLIYSPSGVAVSMATNAGVVFNWNGTIQSGETGGFGVLSLANSRTFRTVSQVSVVPIVRCLGTGSSTGIRFGSIFQNGSSYNYENVYVEGCVTAVSVPKGGNFFIVENNLWCVSTGTCISVANGGNAQLPTTIAMQDGGTDISIDGVTYTVTQLNAASPTWLPTTWTVQGSKVWK